MFSNIENKLDFHLTSEVGVEQSCKTEPLVCGIRCSLQVDGIRVELNCRTPKECGKLLIEIGDENCHW